MSNLYQLFSSVTVMGELHPRARAMRFWRNRSTQPLLSAILTQTIYKKSTDRVKQVGKLMTEIDLASDQAAKLDLNNRLIAEQANIAANKHLAEIIKVKNQEDQDRAAIKATHAFICKEFKGSC